MTILNNLPARVGLGTHKYLGSKKQAFTGPRGLDGLRCFVTNRIIGSPLTAEELALIEPFKRNNASGYLGVQKSYTSKSYRAVFNAFDDLGKQITVDLGHRRNPAEAALLYVMSDDYRKPKLRKISDRSMKFASKTNSLYYFDLDPEDIDIIEYLRTDKNLNGYENVTRQLSNGRYSAWMVVDRRKVYLGSYETPEEAAFAVHVYFTTGNKNLQNKVPRYNEGQNMFKLTAKELEIISYLKTTENVTGYKGVGYTGTRYSANWNAYKKRLSLGKYLSPEQAAWAIHLYLDQGITYTEISVLAKTDKLYPTDRIEEDSTMIKMYIEEKVPLDDDVNVHVIKTREELDELYYKLNSPIKDSEALYE
jgi:hypothetical protein